MVKPSISLTISTTFSERAVMVSMSLPETWTVRPISSWLVNSCIPLISTVAVQFSTPFTASSSASRACSICREERLSSSITLIW